MWLGGKGKALVSAAAIGRAAATSNRPRESEGIPPAAQAGTTTSTT